MFYLLFYIIVQIIMRAGLDTTVLKTYHVPGSEAINQNYYV